MQILSGLDKLLLGGQLQQKFVCTRYFLRRLLENFVAK